MKKIQTDVLNILSMSTINADSLKLPSIQLNRDLYLRVDKVLKALGGKWDRKTKSHIFDSDISDKIEAAVLTGTYTNEKVEFQFFETPENLVKKMIDIARIEDGDNVLEPSAGKGKIAQPIPNCDCVELNDNNYSFLKENGFNVVGRDFLTFFPCTIYDIIIANPPFSKQQDVAHITHMIELANKRVVSIASSSVMWRTNKKTEEFRSLVYRLNGTFTELPKGSFKESGTQVNTCIVFVDKTL